MNSQYDDASRSARLPGWVMSVATTTATVVLCALLFFVVPAAEQLAAELGPLAPVALVAIHASTVVLIPLPAWPITAVNAVVFGAWAGFGLSMVGTVLGSIGAFLLGRRFGWQLVRRIRGVQKYADSMRGSDGLWLVPLLALPIPMGGDIGCYLAGLTPIRLRRFVVLTVVGRLPGNALGVLGAFGVTTRSASALVAAAAGIMALALLNRRWRAAQAQRTEKPETVAPTPIVVREPQPAYDDEHAALAALPRPIAFVFGAGGSHGAVQVGQLRALREHGVSPDLLVGCSVGAMNAALTAADPDLAAQRLDILWRDVRGSDLFCRSDQPPYQRRAVFSDAGLRRLAEPHFPPETTFADLSVPLVLLAGEGLALRKHMLSSGPLLPALLASSALPLLLPSVTIDGTRLVDGGLRHALPVAEAFELGAASVVALPTTRWPRPIGYRASGPIDDPRVVVLGGSSAPGTGWTFGRTDTLIERGYHAASARLAELSAPQVVPAVQS